MTAFSAQAGGLIGEIGDNRKNLDLLRELGENAGMAFHLKKELKKLDGKGGKAEEQIKRCYLNSLSALNKLAANEDGMAQLRAILAEALGYVVSDYRAADASCIGGANMGARPPCCLNRDRLGHSVNRH